MKALVLSQLLLVAANIGAYADDCRDKFAKFYLGSLEGRPGESRIIQQFGEVVTENEFLFLSRDHSLYKPLKPASSQWTMTYMGAMYQSSDGGRSWKKVHSFDSESQHAQNVARMQEQARTAREVMCGEEAIDGVMHDTIEAKLPMPGQANAQIHSRYWISRATGVATKTVTRFKTAGMESVTTQYWKPAPGLTLPKPDEQGQAAQ